MHSTFTADAVSTIADPFFGSFDLGGLIGYLIGGVLLWGVFAKADEPGWQAFVPIWNGVVLLRIAGKPWWWLLLLLIPVVNIVVLFLVWLAVSESFGHSVGFACGLFFLPVIFLLILWLGSSDYRGPGGVSNRLLPHTIY